MSDGKYKITESVGGHREDVHEFSDLAKHHPSSGKEKGREYANINGHSEEIRHTPDGRVLVKKDFILQAEGSATVDIPSPAAGYVYFDKNYGTAHIYSAPKDQGGKLVANVLHMDPDTFHFKSGSYVHYGQGLGIQGGTGQGGKENVYGVHAHVEVELEQFKKYIHDIDKGLIRKNHYPTIETPSQSTAQPQQPAATNVSKTITIPAGGALGQLIAKGEGDYGSYNKGKAGDAHGHKIDFSQMTVGELQRRQDLPAGNADRLFAVGKYQVIPSTMDEAVKALKIKSDEKLTPQLQEHIFADYLIAVKRPDIKAYITGQIGGAQGLHRAQEAMASEWASVADPDTGLSKYGNVGNNKASISADKVANALDTMRGQYQEQIKQGKTPHEAYQSIVSQNTTMQAVHHNQKEQLPHATQPNSSPKDSQHNGVFDKGDRGEDVKHVQQMLASLGAKINADGIYGPKTEQAVKGYQMMNGLVPDGIIGPKTMEALKEDVRNVKGDTVTIDSHSKGIAPEHHQTTDQNSGHEREPAIFDLIKNLPSQAQKLYAQCYERVKEHCVEKDMSWSTSMDNSVAALAAVAHKRGFPGVNVFDVSQAGVFIGYENARGDIFQQALLNGKEIAQIPAQTSLNQIAEHDQRIQHEIQHTQARSMSHSMP